MIKSINAIQKSVEEYNLAIYSLVVSLFFLPLNLNLNNFFLVLFFILFILEGSFEQKLQAFKENYKRTFPIAGLFIIMLIGYLYSTYTESASSQIEKSLPMILLPAYFVSSPHRFYRYSDKFFYGLVAGCIISAFISWGWWIYQLIVVENSWLEAFSWKYSKDNLIGLLDQHTPYLSMFLFISIGFLTKKLETETNEVLRIAYIFGNILLFLFLIQLLSRTAIIYFLVSAIIYLVAKRYFKVLGAIMIVLISFLILLFSQPDDRGAYFKTLLKDQVGLSGSEKIDPRFERWKYSFALFMENPIIGVGTGDAEIKRIIKYREGGDLDAYKNKYNAHNQFLEYLSAQGIIGGLIYLFCFAYLLRLSITSNNKLFLYIVTGIFICCMTESIFRRSWGIVSFSYIVAQLLANSIYLKGAKILKN